MPAHRCNSGPAILQIIAVHLLWITQESLVIGDGRLVDGSWAVKSGEMIMIASPHHAEIPRYATEKAIS